jgi:hypothetical protein
MSMALVIAKLITTIGLAVSNAGAFSTPVQPSVLLPTQAAAPAVVCNPAWGTIVLPICI